MENPISGRKCQTRTRTCLDSSSLTEGRDKCQVLNHELLTFPAQETHVSPAETAAGDSRDAGRDNRLPGPMIAGLRSRRNSKKSSGGVPTDPRWLRGGELLHLLAFTSICSSVPPHIDAGLFLLPTLSHRPPPHHHYHHPPSQNRTGQVKPISRDNL